MNKEVDKDFWPHDICTDNTGTKGVVKTGLPKDLQQHATVFFPNGYQEQTFEPEQSIEQVETPAA